MKSVRKMRFDLRKAGFRAVEILSAVGDTAVFRVEDRAGTADFVVVEGEMFDFFATLKDAESIARKRPFPGWRAGGDELEIRRAEWLTEEMAYLET